MLHGLAIALLLVFGAAPAIAQTGLPAYRESGWCSDHYPADRSAPALQSLPDWVCRETFNRGLQARYVPDTSRNPFFLSGDFDGDGRTDIAIWIRAATGMKRGVLILARGGASTFIAGAGTKGDVRGDDYAGLDLWSLIAKGEALDSPHEGRKIVLRGDALILGKSESSAFIIYWDGRRFAFYQLSD